jgi:hypothetical protein
VLILKVTIKEQLLMLNLVLSQSCCWGFYHSFTHPTTHTLYAYIRRPESSNYYSFSYLILLRTAQSLQWVGNGLDTLEFNSRQRQEFFFFSKMARVVLGPIQPSLQWVPEALPLGVKWPKREGNYSPDLILSLMSRAVLLLPLCVIMASMSLCLIPTNYNFVFPI